MVQKNSLKKVVVIVGPTAVGKTSLSIKLAKKYGSDIINADQSQMHKMLNIGTAKITEEEMSGVKHHLIDFLEPTEQYSIKDFQTTARDIIDNMDCIPFIVGGSGLYVDALITDYDLTVSKRDFSLEKKYDSYSNQDLYNLLYSISSEAAIKTHPNNRNRVMRYLEIVEEKGSLVTKKNDAYYESLILFLNLDRDLLYDRINRRCDIMFNQGWVDEVKLLIDKGYDVSSIKDIGYKEIGQYLQNKITKAEAVEEIKKQTRHYAKRQITWFKNKMNCIEVINNENAFDKICELIDKFLN